MDAGGDALGDFFGDAESGAGMAAADGFAEAEHVGVEPPCGGTAAGAGADGVSFVGDEERAIAAREFASGGPVADVRENDADVGHSGLGEDAGDVVMLEGCFEPVEIVKLDNASGFGGTGRRGQNCAAVGGDGPFPRSAESSQTNLG